MIRATINEHCQGHGRCFELYADLFEPDDQAFGRVTAEFVDRERTPDLQRAAASCPEGAIVLDLADGGKIPDS